MKQILFLKACVNRERSRSLRLAHMVLCTMKEEGSVCIQERVLEKHSLSPLDSERMTKRQALLDAEKMKDSVFRNDREFLDAEEIVIAASYWDFYFPAILKLYLEAVSVPGITYQYTPEGALKGLCWANRLIYVTTRSGMVPDGEDFGFQIIQGLCGYFGIPDICCISLSGLDIPPFDIEERFAEIANAIPEIVRQKDRAEGICERRNSR